MVFCWNLDSDEETIGGLVLGWGAVCHLDHTSFVFLPEWLHCSLDPDPMLSDRTMGCYNYLSSCIVCPSNGWEFNQLLK